MKPVKMLPLLMIAMLSSCNLDPGHSVYTNVVIPVEERITPETGLENQPVNIYVKASADNGCWSGIRFFLSQKDERELEIWALADYESYGACPEMIVSADSILTFTPSRTGDHVVTFWMSNVYYEQDTISITTAAPGR
jgi:hypothetical protein